jgi:hypothetical protein
VVSLIHQFGPFLGLAALLGALALAMLTMAQRRDLRRLSRWAAAPEREGVLRRALRAVGGPFRGRS